MSNVPYREDVTPGELRHALRGYSALGYPPAGYTRGPDGLVTIIIMAPPGANIPDWRGGAFNSAPPMRFRWPRFDWRAWVQIACVVAIVGGLGYLGYSMAVGSPATGHMVAPASPLAPPAGLEQFAADLRAALAGLLPQEAEPQTVPAPWWRFWNQEPDIVQPQAQSAGWPPKNPVGDAIDGTMQAVEWLTYAVIALGALWVVSFVAGIVRRAKGG